MEQHAEKQEAQQAKLAKKIIRNLQRRNMEAYYCPTARQALVQVSALIADGSSVTWGGSMSIRDMGLPQYLRERGTLNVWDRDLADNPEEKAAMYLRAFSADVFLSGANAVSEDGVIVNIDGNGNRVAAITWGPKKVIFIIGMNKVEPTVEAALYRARNTAAPINARRFDIQTPCKRDGKCHNCNAKDSICSCIHFLRNGRQPGRYAVVLVGEPLGY